VPDIISSFRYRNADVFLARIDAIEQAKVDTGGALRKERKIHAVPPPGRAKWIWISEPGGYCHKLRQTKSIPLCALCGRRANIFSVRAKILLAVFLIIGATAIFFFVHHRGNVLPVGTTIDRILVEKSERKFSI
jgi:hypothetical protein